MFPLTYMYLASRPHFKHTLLDFLVFNCSSATYFIWQFNLFDSTLYETHIWRTKCLTSPMSFYSKQILRNNDQRPTLTFSKNTKISILFVTFLLFDYVSDIYHSGKVKKTYQIYELGAKLYSL